MVRRARNSILTFDAPRIIRGRTECPQWNGGEISLPSEVLADCRRQRGLPHRSPGSRQPIALARA